MTNELIEMVSGKVNSGLYGDASEVINAALRRMDEYDQSQQFAIRQIEHTPRNRNFKTRMPGEQYWYFQ